jgi:type I restriction enzyme M protein
MMLGQFYTPALAGGLLVQGVGNDAPAQVCDLGAGEGELLLAAQRRWRQARLLAVDIDPANVSFTRQRLFKAECRQVDVLRHDLPRLLGIEEDSIDVALGNPPYGALDIQPKHIAILRDAGLHDAVSVRRITRDVVFLAQNLRLLKPGGELAVILPEGLAVNRTFEDLRTALMERHGLHRVIELPSGLFQGTEARTVAMFLKKGQRAEIVHLETSAGESILVSQQMARRRLDARFHLREAVTGRTLGDLNPTIHRGALSHADALKVGESIFHTTTFKDFPTGRVRLGNAFHVSERWAIRSGDILIPRVGSRCLSHVAAVERGMAIFTDCIYRIRVNPRDRELVLRALRSVSGVSYRLIAAHGTCAAVLSKTDLLNLPLG